MENARASLQSWLRKNRVAVVRADNNVAATRKRRILTVDQVKAMIQEAVVRRRKSWEAELREESMREIRKLQERIEQAEKQLQEIRLQESRHRGKVARASEEIEKLKRLSMKILVQSRNPGPPSGEAQKNLQHVVQSLDRVHKFLTA